VTRPGAGRAGHPIDKEPAVGSGIHRRADREMPADGVTAATAGTARALFCIAGKSPVLPGSRNIKGAYSEDVATAIGGVRDHFPPSNFSMSPEGLSALIALVNLAG